MPGFSHTAAPRSTCQPPRPCGHESTHGTLRFSAVLPQVPSTLFDSPVIRVKTAFSDSGSSRPASQHPGTPQRCRADGLEPGACVQTTVDRKTSRSPYQLHIITSIDVPGTDTPILLPVQPVVRREWIRSPRRPSLQRSPSLCQGEIGSLLPRFSAFCGEESGPSGGIGMAPGEVRVSDPERGARHAVARARDTPAARARDLGDEHVDVETIEHTTGLGATLLGIVREALVQDHHPQGLESLARTPGLLRTRLALSRLRTVCPRRRCSPSQRTDGGRETRR